jgi:hypothetical protein
MRPALEPAGGRARVEPPAEGRPTTLTLILTDAEALRSRQPRGRTTTVTLTRVSP